MDARLGWALAVAAVALGYVQYGWPGVAMAVSAIVFWLLMQFTRALRAMRTAGGAPVGHVASAVMLHAGLKPGKRLMDVVLLTHSLGHQAEPDSGADEAFRWADASGASVTLQFKAGRVASWQLQRPEDARSDGGAAGRGPTPPGA